MDGAALTGSGEWAEHPMGAAHDRRLGERRVWADGRWAVRSGSASELSQPTTGAVGMH